MKKFMRNKLTIRSSSEDRHVTIVQARPSSPDRYYPNKAEYSRIFRKDKIAHLVHSQYGTEVSRIVQRSYKDLRTIFI